MIPTTAVRDVAFGLLTALVLVSAVWVVTLRNLFRSALCLGLVLLGVAGLFILLEAEFLAFVQILVYVGAVLVLVVFAIMLTARLHGDSAAPVNRASIPAAVASFALFAILATLTQSISWPREPMGAPVEVRALGQQFMTSLVLPFEVISLVFVAAIVGAIAIAASRRPSTERRPPRSSFE